MFYKNLVKMSMAVVISSGMCASMPMPIQAQTIQSKVVTIGQKQNADYSFKIKNQLKNTIRSLRIKTSDEETFRANELPSKKSIKNNKYVKFNYTLFDGETADTNFMLRIELKNGKIYTLTNFPMSAIYQQVSIKMKNGIVYLRYKTTDGTYVSTYQQEKAALTVENDDGTETVNTNETEKEDAEASQYDDNGSSDSNSTSTTKQNGNSMPVQLIQQQQNSSDNENDASADTSNSTTKPVKPYGGACSTAESCAEMRKQYEAEGGQQAPASNSEDTAAASNSAV